MLPSALCFCISQFYFGRHSGLIRRIYVDYTLHRMALGIFERPSNIPLAIIECLILLSATVLVFQLQVVRLYRHNE